MDAGMQIGYNKSEINPEPSVSNTSTIYPNPAPPLIQRPDLYRFSVWATTTLSSPIPPSDSDTMAMWAFHQWTIA